jgi:flavin-dependent dehydrogenase
MHEFDAVVLGGGPGGSAAAITCARAGLRVALVERSAFPRPAPGETLHPGALPLLRRLGVEDEVLAAGFLRHAGPFVRWGGAERFVPFGSDVSGPWLGLQAWRPTFDAILLDQARGLGVRVEQPSRPRRVLAAVGSVTGVVSDAGALGLNEARTDPDVEEANNTGDDKLVGWISAKGEEIGDFPIFEDTTLTHVFKEVSLADNSGTVPIQFMYSNRVNGPEDPTL